MLIIVPGQEDIFSIFFHLKVCCVFSLESPRRGDSNEYTQYTIHQYKKENHAKLFQIQYLPLWDFLARDSRTRSK